MDYDKTPLPDKYDQGRDHGPAFLELWMDVVAKNVDSSQVRNIVDLGCGTGRFSQGLAERFNANLIGIDPSTKMLGQALSKRTGDRVLYANGLAEAIPLPTDSMDLIFISMVFHHFTDPLAVARECRRVLRTDGRVCLRTASSEQISAYPYVPFFPTSRPLLERQLPSITVQQKAFESASFRTMSRSVVTQEIAPDYSAYADKLATKSDSILARLDEKDFEMGLNAVRSYAGSTPPRPVSEPIDFLVFV